MKLFFLKIVQINKTVHLFLLSKLTKHVKSLTSNVHFNKSTYGSLFAPSFCIKNTVQRRIKNPVKHLK